MIDEIFRDGPLTSLVNNAAGNFIARTEDLSPRGFDAIANIVMHGTFYVTQAVGKRWIKGGHRGSVVSITVTWVRNGGPFVAPSAMSKAAIDAMTKSLAVEWGRYGIRLNAITPGEIPTEGMSKRLAPGKDSAFGTKEVNPFGRVGRIEELQNLAAFLLSDGCEWLTGETIAMDGAQALATGGKLLRIAPMGRRGLEGGSRGDRGAERAGPRTARVTSGSLLGGATVLKLDDLFACTPSDEGVARPRGCLCNTPAFARLNARLSSKFCRGGLDVAAGVFAAGAGGSTAKAAASWRRTAFVNARVFDGKSDNLRTGLRVVIEGGTIRAVEAADAPIGQGGAIVDCGGRVLMPHRRALACDDGGDPARRAAHRRRRLYQSRRRGRGRRHAHVRLHQRPRHGGPRLRAQAGDRRGRRQGTAHLAVGAMISQTADTSISAFPTRLPGAR